MLGIEALEGIEHRAFLDAGFVQRIVQRAQALLQQALDQQIARGAEAIERGLADAYGLGQFLQRGARVVDQGQGQWGEDCCVVVGAVVIRGSGWGGYG